MIIDSYTDLVSNLQNITEDDSAELLEYLPTAIDQAEERLFKDLDLPDLEKTGTGSLSGSVRTVSKPSDYLYGFHLYITNGSNEKELEKRRSSFIRDYWPDASETATPEYYADESENTFSLAPTPDTGYNYTLEYQAKPTKLSSSNQTNYYTEKVSDGLFFAVMSEVVKFQKAWTQVQIWEERYGQFVQTWNLQASQQRSDGSIAPNNMETTENTKKHTSQTNA